MSAATPAGKYRLWFQWYGLSRGDWKVMYQEYITLTVIAPKLEPLPEPKPE